MGDDERNRCGDLARGPTHRLSDRFVGLVSPLCQTVKPSDISAFFKTNLDTSAQFTKGTVNRMLERKDVQDLQLDEG